MSRLQEHQWNIGFLSPLLLMPQTSDSSNMVSVSVEATKDQSTVRFLVSAIYRLTEHQWNFAFLWTQCTLCDISISNVSVEGIRDTTTVNAISRLLELQWNFGFLTQLLLKPWFSNCSNNSSHQSRKNSAGFLFDGTSMKLYVCVATTGDVVKQYRQQQQRQRFCLKPSEKNNSAFCINETFGVLSQLLQTP